MSAFSLAFQGEGKAQTPDITSVRFVDLASVAVPGRIDFPTEWVNQVGYNPGRSWQAGARPESVLTLGDLDPAFGLNALSLNSIGRVTGINVASQSLATFPVVGQQTLNELAQAVPSLLDRPVSQLTPISDRLLQAAINPGNQSFRSVLQSRTVGELRLDTLPLEHYGLDSLPGLTTTSLSQFQHWQGSAIASIPGLRFMPFGAFPRPPLSGVPMPVDVVFGDQEQSIQQTVSGSLQAGFNVACDVNCAHLELGGRYLGSRWVSGLSQMVPGGYGFLRRLNNGYEPTGRHPFGTGFKVTVLAVDERSGTATTGLYFRICIKGRFFDLGCSPYFIGPVPWFTVQETGFIIG